LELNRESSRPVRHPKASSSDPRDNLKLQALVRKHGNLRDALLEAASG